MRVHLLRHPPPAIEAGVCYGRLDVPVEAEAQPAIELLAERVATQAPHAVVWTSPARRCLALAEPVARRCGRAATIDPLLQELDFGAWEGRRWDELPRAELDRWAAAPDRFRPPGGECVAALIDRVRAFCAGLRRDGRDCVVVTHGGPLRVMPALLRGAPIDLLATPPGFGTGLVLGL